MKRKLSFLFGVLTLAACSLAPDYEVPATPAPAAYKESGDWVLAQPADASEHGAWWKAFLDPQLDAFEDQVTQANQSLKAALAQYDQARALAAQARSAYFPTITGNAGASRNKISRNLANNAPVTQSNDFTFGADLTYEIDIWGRVRNTVAANEDQAQASAADLAGVALSLHAELADDYFALRGDDAAQEVLDKTVEADRKAFDLTKRRFDGGVSPESDLDQAQTQLENAKTQATDMRLQRAQLEHAIAVLTGHAPADFNLASAPLAAQLPMTNPGLPSTLLQRRPDIASAERKVAAANAEIGVARAAWFPAFSLTGSAGFESAHVVSLFDAPSHFWSLGPSAMMTLLDGGAISALNDQARAAYDQSAASYRETVLEAYQDVEDNLVAMHRLAQESKTQETALTAAKRQLAQANSRYIGGATTYLDVVVAQNTQLQAQLGQINILTRQLVSDVQLIRAIGGGWSIADIANAGEGGH